MFKGSIVASITPMENGKVDTLRFKEHIEWLIENESDGIVPCGSTGESATLTHEEHKKLIDIAVKTANGRVKIIAGTGSNATREAIEFTRSAKDSGADGALLISPYYNKPTQEGVYQHHMEVADAVDIPQILYNVPGRTALNILPQTVARLASHENIVGIKEATGSIEQAIDVLAETPAGFLLLSGDDFINQPMLAIGGHGSISVTANIVPKKMAEMHRLFSVGERDESLKIHFELRELSKAMFIETNPIPVKTLLAMMGKANEEFRLPLTKMAEENRVRLQKVLKKYSLI